AVNDGKLTTRLRNGGRITTDTLDRIRAFITSNSATALARPAIIARPREEALISTSVPAPSVPALQPAHSLEPSAEENPPPNFRFFDNRKKYLLFVNTCSEKWVVANRVTLELANIHPRPPAVRMFDAGVGDGTVMLRVLRAMHDRFPHMPFY